MGGNADSEHRGNVSNTALSMKDKDGRSASKQDLLAGHLGAVFPLFLILAFLPSVSLFEEFDVVASIPQVVASIESDVILTFYLSPALNAEWMEIGFSRSMSLRYVHLYRNGRDEYRNQMKEYRGRTWLEKGNITSGNVSLVIGNVAPSDAGEYRCYFQAGNYHRDAFVDLVVTALGLDPLITISESFKAGITAECESDGWYPEPEVTWQDSAGNTLQSLHEKKELDTKGLFNVKSTIVVLPKTALSCSIRNIPLHKGRGPSIILSDTIFDYVNRCALHRFLVIPIIIICFVLIIILMGKYMEKKEEKYNCNNILENSLDDKIALLKRCLQAEEVAMTVDPKMVKPGISVSENGKRVRSNVHDVTDGCARLNTRYQVLGKETFKTGIVYWEIEAKIGDCAVGIAKTSASCNGQANGLKEKTTVRLDEFNNTHSTVNQRTIRLKMCLDFNNATLTIFRLHDMKSISKPFTYGEVCLYLELTEDSDIEILT